MKTIYNGEISDKAIDEYYDMLIGRIWKLIPLKEIEEKPYVWKREWKSLLNELASGSKLFNDSGLFIEIMAKLQSLENLEHIPFNKDSKFRKCVLETIDVITQYKRGQEVADDSETSN